jgi:hypothetical protein
MMRVLPFLAAALLVTGCAAGSMHAADPEVTIRISNPRAEPLQCRLIFGHWVERYLGLVTGAGVAVTVQQQPEDGALYNMRPDGQRRMMVENIFCARPDDWQATVGQVDLSVVRTARPKEVSVRCALPESGGRVKCDPPELQ